MFDIIIKNGIIIDGSGKEKFRADVGINNGQVVDIGDLKDVKSEREIDAKDLFVCPGFIDVLNHSDSYFKIFTNPTLDSMALQGVTTIIGGNCGSSLAPIAASFTMKDLKKRMGFRENVIAPPAKSGAIVKSIRRWIDVAGININWTTLSEFFDVLMNRGISLNFGTLIGHGSLRRNLVGEKISDLSKEELDFFKELIKDSLAQGALGMSCGLSYSHENFVETSELLELASVLADNDGIMTFHIRNESDRFLESIREIIEIAKRSAVRVEISHLKVLGKENRSQLEEAIADLENVNEKGVGINFDFYPYNFSWSVFYPYLPNWISRGGREKLLKRLAVDRDKVLKSLTSCIDKIKFLIIAYSPFNKSFVGKSFEDIAKDQGTSIEEAIINVLLGSRGHLICFDKSISEDNVVRKVQHSLGIVVSDGVGFHEEENRLGQLAHPRCFGTFPRFLGRYVREGLSLKWEKAIQKITSMPALKYGINDRGFIQKDLKADITIFDPDKIIDRATLENPFQYSVGVDYVLVNGKLVVDKGEHTGELVGEIVKK